MADTPDYYGAGNPDSDETTAASGGEMDNGDQTPENKQGDDETAEGESALVPKSIFGDSMPAVGDVIQMRVEHIYDDEIEVCPMGDEEAAEGESAKKKSTMSGAMNAFDQMNQSGNEEQ